MIYAVVSQQREEQRAEHTGPVGMLHTGGGWGETPPPHDCKALWVYSNTQESAI